MADTMWFILEKRVKPEHGYQTMNELPAGAKIVEVHYTLRFFGPLPINIRQMIAVKSRKNYGTNITHRVIGSNH